MLRPADAAIEVDVVPVSRGEVRDMVAAAASGEVKPARRVTVRAEVGGTVAEVKKRKGERVEAGDLIVAFRSDEVDARLQQAAANVDAARVSVTMAKTRQQTADHALSRAKKLRSSEAISDVDLERAQTEATAAKEAIDQAVAAEKQALAAQKIAEVSKRHSIAYAPFAGVLQEQLSEVGVRMAPGQALFDLIDDSSVHVDVPIDESDMARVFVGQRASLKSDSRRGAPLFGTVTLIPPAVGKPAEVGGIEAANVTAAQLGSRDRSLYVEVTPDEPKSLRVGASVNAELLVTARASVLFVPSNVILSRGVVRTVLRVVNGVAKKAEFKAGLSSWERTEIVSGLDEAELVIASLNVKELEDGAPVRVRAKLIPPALTEPAGLAANRP
jgi:HlyD family secretion protein